MSKIILYIAISKDGYIADIDGNVDWLPQPENESDLEVFGYNKLQERIDTILMGSKSFEQILGFGDWAWPDKKTYVFTSRALEAPLECIAIRHDTPREFMNEIKNIKSDKDIWLLGGAALAKSFAQEALIDEIILTIVPSLLGEGIALGIDLDGFELNSEKTLMGSMVQKIYVRQP